MVMRTLRRLQPIFMVLALLFVAGLLRSQWDQLQDYQWRLSPGWLLASGLLLLASWAMEVGIWRSLLALVGGPMDYGPALRIWFLSAIMRYIPGNIWQPLSMTVRCQQWGVRPEATLTSVALYQAIILLAVAPITALYIAISGETGLGLLGDFLRGTAPWLVAITLIPVIAFLVRPQWLMALINWGLHKIGREMLDARLTSRRLLALLAVAAVNWLLWGASFAALTFGLSEYSLTRMGELLPFLVLSYPIAYAIGFLSFITPSGFGVREGAFYLLLAPLMGGGVVTVAALAMRIWTTIGELIMAGISAIWERFGVQSDRTRIERI
jgi:uncharacterized membrane protein YbhN (UPF0104 family)